jgi:hypothetical protein
MDDCTCSTRTLNYLPRDMTHALGCPSLGGKEEWDDLEQELRSHGKITP